MNIHYGLQKRISMSKLGKVLKEKGIPQVQLVRSIGVTKGTISIMVQKGIKNIATAKRYAAAIGCNWTELVD